MVVTSEQPASNLHPVRSYLRAGDIPPPTVGAYGVVAFRSRPTPASRARLLGVCNAYRAYLPRQDTLPPSVPVGGQMVTVWPLDQPGAPEAARDDCGFVIDHYDLYGGISAIQDAERQGARLDSNGPFLIGWSPSNARGVRDKVVLVVDLSSFDSQASFDEAFLFWQRKVVQNPELWRSGFAVERVRLAIRDFVDHYGAAILGAVKLFGGQG